MESYGLPLCDSEYNFCIPEQLTAGQLKGRKAPPKDGASADIFRVLGVVEPGLENAFPIFRFHAGSSECRFINQLIYFPTV